jgi:methylmalonyl-CoA/ethylmalonyl-CoA epimerase
MQPAAPGCDLVFDHIGIAVPELEKAERRLEQMLGRLSWTSRFDDQVLGVAVTFAKDAAGVVYELIAPIGDASPIAGALKSKANIINQIAYRTGSLDVAAKSLRAAGAVPLGPSRPAIAFGGAHVQFFLSRLGFIVEIIERHDDLHVFNRFLGD